MIAAGAPVSPAISGSVGTAFLAPFKTECRHYRARRLHGRLSPRNNASRGRPAARRGGAAGSVLSILRMELLERARLGAGVARNVVLGANLRSLKLIGSPRRLYSY